MRPGERKRCEACGCEMIGALTSAGRVAPIEQAPAETGNVLLFRAPPPAGLAATFGEVPVVQCRTFGEGMALMELREQGVPMRLSHFATCPEAERFGRSGRT